MAETSGTENLILIYTEHEEPHLTVYLFPKSDYETVKRRMGSPGKHSHLFSLGRLSKLAEGGHPVPGGYLFVDRAVRGPLEIKHKLDTILRTRWLGRAEDTINEDIAMISELMEQIKHESTRAVFPVRESGTAL